jgi:hypothetical protein
MNLGQKEVIGSACDDPKGGKLTPRAAKTMKLIKHICKILYEMLCRI